MRMRALLPAIAMAASLAGCSVGPCENEVLDRVTSPDGKMAALVFSRECGATTGANIQISIVGEGIVPHDAGNTFIMDGASYSPDIRPRWIDGDHLVLTIPEYSRVFLKNSLVERTRISYQDKRTGFEPD